MLVGNSLQEYILIRFAILGLRIIAPLSIIYSTVLLFYKIASGNLSDGVDYFDRCRLPLPLEIYLFLEAGFFLVIYLPLRAWLQTAAIHPEAPSHDERRQLFNRVLDGAPDVKRYLSGWLLGAEVNTIELETIKEFTAWSLFNRHVEELDDAEVAELDEYVSALEEKTGHAFRPGSGNTKSLRTTFDPVPMQHRPLVWYLIVFIIDAFTHARLLHAFRFYRASDRLTLSTFPPRPLTFFGHTQRPSARLSYWYKEHKSKTRLPIVFIHGIGIGLYAYADFILQLASQQVRENASDDQIGIIVIEILPISSRICPPALTTPEIKHEIQQILETHGWHDFVLLGHSYGTAIASTILRDKALSQRVKAAMLMDPICFLLSLPDVAFNFTRRKPRQANERMLNYFSSQDMLISHTLARRFFWSEYILWKEDLKPDMPFVVILSAKDLIVPAKEVWSYLTNAADSSNTSASRPGLQGTTESEDGNLEVLCFNDFDHAGLFASKGARRGVAGIARRLCDARSADVM